MLKNAVLGSQGDKIVLGYVNEKYLII